jgi:hypothetical protein
MLISTDWRSDLQDPKAIEKMTVLRNADGIPVFPDVIIQEASLAGIIRDLEVYLQALWSVFHLF